MTKQQQAENLILTAAAQAIAEGMDFYKVVGKKKIQPVSQRLNNPGCLPSWFDGRGTPMPVLNGFVDFPNEQAGWSALRTQCKILVFKRRNTLRQMFQGKFSLDDPADALTRAVNRASTVLGVRILPDLPFINYLPSSN